MTIGFENIKSIPQLIKDFLAQNLDGFESKVFDIKNVEKQITEKSGFSKDKRNLLTEVIKTQNSGFSFSARQVENIEKLRDHHTFTVTTGHQLNLFTGPVFFVYKILQTIKTAAFLKEKFPQYHFVPIFWMATEDHDFQEINHFKTRKHYYEINGKSGGDVGSIKIEDQFFIEQFEDEFKNHVFGTELILLMKHAYQLGHTHTEAIRYLVNEIFSEYGLLCLDANNAELKSQAKDVFRKELMQNLLFTSTQKQRTFLENRYHKVQVNPREINLFYLSETRNRIVRTQKGYEVLDTNLSFSEEELLSQLETNPEKFSPNAVLRPAYQETILPNLAYIGGNAEIMYWIELKDYFEAASIPFPILIPRNSMLFLDEKICRKIEKQDLGIIDFINDFTDVVNAKLIENHELSELLDRKEKELIASFTSIKQKAYTTDKTFENLVKAEETRQLKSFQRMKNRLLKAEKIKHSEKMDYLQSLFLDIHPGGVWQERVYNFSVFYAEMGKEWIDLCYEKIDVQKSELIIATI